MANLANKYRPSTFEDVVEQGLVVKMIQKFCEDPDMNVRNFLLIGPAGTGKAQPLYSKVLTPNGFIEMCDVQLGTEVFTANGNVAKVSGIFPQGVRDIYEIELQDRTTIRVSDEHLNVCYWYNEHKKKREDFVLTTAELYEKFATYKRKLRMDVPTVDWEKHDLPIDPYLLGALIGDGSLSGNFGFSNCEPDVVAKVDGILRRDWNKCLKLRKGSNKDYFISNVDSTSSKYSFEFDSVIYNTLSDFQKMLMDNGYPKFCYLTLLNMAEDNNSVSLKQYPELRGRIKIHVNPNYHTWKSGDPLKNTLSSLGLLVKSSEKHIPKEYLFADRESRLNLLQGLYDTDGYTERGGATTYTTCSEQLSEDFAFLVRSLGIRDTVVDHLAKYKLNDDWIYTGNIAHDHNLKIPNELQYCTSVKHMGRHRSRQNPPLRNIVDIRYIGEEECQCIYVDHPDHTYISDGFIPTHNTTLGRIMAKTINGNGSSDIIEIDAASHNGVEEVRKIVEQSRTYPIGSKYRIWVIDECHSITSTGWQALLKVLEEAPARNVFIFLTTNPEKIPQTILSRVQTFQLSKISVDGISNRIKNIIELENSEGQNITYEDTAITYISKLANGGLRDALTLLDRVISYSTNITSESVMTALNLPAYDDYFLLLASYAKHDNETITKLIDKVYNSGVNFVKWFEGFHSFVTNVTKYIFMQDISATMIPAHYLDKVSKYGPKHSVVCMRLSNLLLKLIYDLKSTTYLQEVALTYLCVPQLPKKE